MLKLTFVACLVAVLSVSSHLLFAQTKPSAPEKPSAKDFADEAAVVERDEVVYRYHADGTGTRVQTTAVRLQSEAALQSFAVLSFPYASGTQQLEIVHAGVRKPDGSMVETPAADAQDQPAPATQIAPMYSDLHIKQLPIRSMAVGDMLEFETKTTTTQAEVTGEFWGSETFGLGLVYLDRRVELHVPKSKTVNVYSPKFPPSVSESGDERVYRWSGSQLRRSNAKDDDDTPQDKTAPVAWTTFPSWEAVGAWYQGVIAGRDAITPALQAKADELTAGTKTKGEMVRVLYEYVSQHNHYVGVDFGVGRYQPHTAAEVLANQYGDCKDKHTLLAALLRAKGFQPSAALIGVGIEMNEKVPMPGAFNHVITFVDVDGEPVWLDTTTEVAPYRVLLPTVRDKQALIVPDKGDPVEPHLAKTPADLPFPAVDHYEGTFQLMKDGTTKGDVAISLRGDDEVLMRYASRMVARAQWDMIGQTYVQTTGFNGKANGVNLGAGADLSAPWSMRYSYTQEPWAQWKNFQIGSLLPNVAIPSIDKDKPPKEEIDFGGRHTQSAKSTVRLPEGYGVELPDPIHLKTTFATFDETYQVKDGSLISEFRLEVLQPKVPAKEWKGVKEFADKIGTQPWIQVISGGHSVLDKSVPRIGENNQAAFQLVREVYEAIVAKDYELARKKSDQALAINDKQAYLWSQRGFLAARTGNLKEAAEDYEREISQHPEAVDQYSTLIQLEGQLGKSAEKHKYLLEYAKAAPADPKAVLFVGHQLLAENDVEDALSEYRAGSKALPDNALVQVEFGNALLKAGKDEEAQPILEKALGSSTDTNVLNSGAYALAEHHVMLPLAETSAQKAVDTLEAESAGTGIGSVNATSFQHANLMLACWDTLGWIYFAEGKSELAEEYVMASWKSAVHPEEGLHAGAILEKKGDAKGALRAYEMAVSRTGNNTEVAILTELRTRIDRLKKTGLADQEPNPGRDLQEQRTFHVSRPPGMKGSGVFAVQVSAAKTENVAMLSGDDAVRGMSEALAGLKLGLAVPRESHALLLRSGVLFCSTESTCEFVLTPPESASVK